MGAYDVHNARLIGTVAAKTGITPFMELAERVMSLEAYASADSVFWVVDNGSSHKGPRSLERMNSAWPNAQLVHLPVHLVVEPNRGRFFCHPTQSDPDQPTSLTWPPSKIVWNVSRTTTTRPRNPSTGGSPGPIWRPCLSGSTPAAVEATTTLRSPPEQAPTAKMRG
jgi:hypothetical protein